MLPSKSTHRSFTRLQPLDETTLKVGMMVTVLDWILTPPQSMIDEMTADHELGEGVTFTISPVMDIERMKGYLFKVESICWPIILCSCRSPVGKTIGITPIDARRVKLAPVSRHYQKKMRKLFLELNTPEVRRPTVSQPSTIEAQVQQMLTGIIPAISQDHDDDDPDQEPIEIEPS